MAASPHVRERSPVDVLRLVIGGGTLLVLVVLGRLFGDALVTFATELLRGLDAVPDWMINGTVIVARVLGTVVVFGGILAALVTRRFRLLGTLLLAALLAGALYAGVEMLVPDEAGSIVDVDDSLGVLTDEEYPTAGGLAVTAAIATAAAPWLSRGWRRAFWALVVSEALSHFLTAPVTFDTVYALASGWTVGSLVLVVLGGPVRRPDDDRVSAGLAGVGVDLATLERASVDARGSTPYFGTTRGGQKLFVKVLGVDERSADLLFRAYRKIVPYDLGDERSFSSLRRTVEHEALVALTAAQFGVRTPRVVAFAHVEPDAYVLAYEAIDGKSLDGVDPARLDDETLAAVWGQVAMLRRHRIAHRDLRLANVFLAADGEVWMIDFGFSELAASDLLLANDLAELVASLSLAVGPERAVAAGRAAVGADVLATAAPRLRGFALSGATRTGMKANPGLLDDVRTRVVSELATT